MSGSRRAAGAKAAIRGRGTALAPAGRVHRLLLFIALFVAGAPLTATTAHAENCVQKSELEPGDTRTPCWDVGAGFGRLESYVTPGRTGLYVNTRIVGPHIFVENNGRTIDDPRPRTAIRVDMGTKEILNLGDGEYTFFQIAGVRYQRDLPLFGAYVGGFAVSKWHEHYRILTPTAGVRVGDFATAALIAEARMPGLFLVGTGSQTRSLTANYDVSLRGTLALRRYLRLEGRARFRNFEVKEEMRQSDIMLSAGIEGSIPGKLGFRITPVFLGLGVRFVGQHDEWKFHPVREQSEFLPVEDRGFEIMVLCDLDMGLSSTNSIW